LHELTAQTLAGFCGLNEERANARRIRNGIEEGVRACLDLIAPEQGAALAPATTRYDRFCVLDDEVSAVLDELSVDAENMTCDGFRLHGRVIRQRKFAAGSRDEALQSRHVGHGGAAKLSHRTAAEARTLGRPTRRNPELEGCGRSGPCRG
jgi:hypothetical protein